MRVFISQPMSGLSQEEIIKIRTEAEKRLTNLGFEVIDSFYVENFDEIQEEILELSGIKNTAIHYLGKSISKLAVADTIYFCDGWENSKGCQIEHKIAELYNVSMMYQTTKGNKTQH